jgi:dolichol kinase
MGLRRSFQGFLVAFGVTLVISVIVVGPPHPFFVAMLGLELVLPVLMVLVGRRVAAGVDAYPPSVTPAS